MRSYFQKLRARRTEDRGDAILVMSVIFVSLFALCAGMAIDLSKSAYTKSSFQLMTQTATTEAIRLVNQQGNLPVTVPAQIVTSYKAQFDGEAGAMARSSHCNKVQVNGVEYTAPYIEITLEQARGQASAPVTYRSVGGDTPQPMAGSYSTATRYTVARTKVYESSPNLMMGIFGIPCQQLYSEVASTTFGTQQDVDRFYGTPTP